ncbi:AraC family transcriptional regulator [Pseudomonas sp. Marseille-QA0892]
MSHSHLTTLHAVALGLELASERGMPNPDLLLANSGIQPTQLRYPDMRITVAQERQVFLNATARYPDLGLDIGSRMHVTSYGLLGYTLLSAATLGDALRIAFAYPALLGTLFELRLRVDGDTGWIEARGYRESEMLEVFNTEFCLTSLKLICGDLLSRAVTLRAAHFRHTQPAYGARYADTFGCPTRFSTAENAFGFDASLLAERLPLADAVTHRDMLERIDRLNLEFVQRQDLITRARGIISATLPGALGLKDLAQALGCSSRSLRRRFQEAGTHYQALLDEVRYEQARALLHQEHLPISHVAEVMGYSETASFRHAFRRWSGMSPRHFRYPRAG